jgi:methylated-DNA-[protein]-cysteine S-methyltransferase
MCKISYNKAMKPTPTATLLFSSSIGSFWLERNARGLTHCEILADNTPAKTLDPSANLADPLLHQAAEELWAYLKGSLRAFSVPLDLSELTPFQQKVLASVALIPWGETHTYAEIAAQTGKPKAIRAVGNALAHNPLLLFIPCHRVIGSDGKLHGFSASQGIALKAWLLDHEGVKISENNLHAQPREDL